MVAWAVATSTDTGATRGVHVHHGAEASDALAETAAELAGRLGIPFTRIDVDVPAGASYENQARSVRLAAISNVGESDEWLVTGHHEGDSVETVLNNLFRGAGALGLSGIAAVRGAWLRPLLEVEATTVRQAAADLQLPFLDDPANTDPRHRRNVIRDEVVPWLAGRLDVPIGRVVTRSARSLAADDASLAELAARVSIGSRAGATVVAASVLSTVPTAVGARIARRALRVAHPPYPGTARDVKAVLTVASGPVRRLALAGGLMVEREGPLVAIHAGVESAPRQVLLHPGENVDFGFWRVGMGCVKRGPRPSLGLSRIYARAEFASQDIVVRGAVAGERVALAEGSKSIRDALAERGVPVRLRPAWPVVAVGAKIAWVAGVRAAAWFTARPAAGEPIVELSVEGVTA